MHETILLEKCINYKPIIYRTSGAYRYNARGSIFYMIKNFSQDEIMDLLVFTFK